MPCRPPAPEQMMASSSINLVQHPVMWQFPPFFSLLPQHKGNLPEIHEAPTAEDQDQHLMAVFPWIPLLQMLSPPVPLHCLIWIWCKSRWQPALQHQAKRRFFQSQQLARLSWNVAIDFAYLCAMKVSFAVPATEKGGGKWFRLNDGWVAFLHSKWMLIAQT